jgi:hypothetical protein
VKSPKNFLRDPNKEKENGREGGMEGGRRRIIRRALCERTVLQLQLTVGVVWRKDR